MDVLKKNKNHRYDSNLSIVLFICDSDLYDSSIDLRKTNNIDDSFEYPVNFAFYIIRFLYILSMYDI